VALACYSPTHRRASSRNLPPSAANLLQTIAMYTGGQQLPTQPIAATAPASVAPIIATPGTNDPAGAAPLVPNPSAPSGNQIPADLQAIRVRLADSSRRLARIVDPSWQRYLALPAEVYGGNTPACAGWHHCWLTIAFTKISSDANITRSRSIRNFAKPSVC